MVDTHVHLMDPGPTDREDFPTGTSAAAASGVTTIVEHTHGHPVREVADFIEKAEYLRDRSYVDFGLAAHAWPDRVDRIPDLWRAGVVFFKIFTCDTHGLPGFTPADVLSAFRTLARAGAPCLVHCEDDSITAAAEQALRESGWDDGAVLPEWRNREAELVATAATSILARATGTRATIAHVSHPGAAELITDQRRRGGDVAAEACPQYFLLREHEALDHGAFRKFTPPARARSDEDEEEMWRLLREGVLTHVSTDHAPATREQKTNGDIWSVHFGLPGLDSTFRLLLDAGLTGRLEPGGRGAGVRHQPGPPVRAVAPQGGAGAGRRRRPRARRPGRHGRPPRRGRHLQGGLDPLRRPGRAGRARPHLPAGPAGQRGAPGRRRARGPAPPRPRAPGSGDGGGT